MNKPALFLLLALSLGSLPAVADSVGNISTLTGKVYRRCEIVKVHPDGVSFTHTKGAAKVLFSDLPEEWRQRLGYDPVKAAAYEQELADRRKQQADARAARQAELGKALAMAQEMELTRLRIEERQATAMMQAAAANAVPFDSGYTLPLLGPIWDGRSFHNQYRGGTGVWNRDGRWCNPGFGYPWVSSYGFPGPGPRACPPRRSSYTFTIKP